MALIFFKSYTSHLQKLHCLIQELQKYFSSDIFISLQPTFLWKTWTTSDFSEGLFYATHPHYIPLDGKKGFDSIVSWTEAIAKHLDTLSSRYISYF